MLGAGCSFPAAPSPGAGPGSRCCNEWAAGGGWPRRAAARPTLGLGGRGDPVKEKRKEGGGAPGVDAGELRPSREAGVFGCGHRGSGTRPGAARPPRVRCSPGSAAPRGRPRPARAPPATTRGSPSAAPLSRSGRAGWPPTGPPAKRRKLCPFPLAAAGVPTPWTLHPAAGERRGHGGAEEGRAASGQRRGPGGQGARAEAAARRRRRGARWQLPSPACTEQPGAVASQTVRLDWGPRGRWRGSPAGRDGHRSRRGHHFLRAALCVRGLLHHPGGRQLPEGRRSGDGGGGRA